MSDRWLRVVAPIIAQASRQTPHPMLDEVLAGLLAQASSRGLRSLEVDVARVIAGGDVVLPARPDRRQYRDE